MQPALHTQSVLSAVEAQTLVDLERATSNLSKRFLKRATTTSVAKLEQPVVTWAIMPLLTLTPQLAHLYAPIPARLDLRLEMRPQIS
eukprot:4779403-Prymnesium_polylepis.1